MIASRFEDQEETKRKPAGKMTTTQRKFGGYNDNRGSSEDSNGGLKNKLNGMNNFMKENSSNSSIPRGIGAKKKTGNGKGKKGGKGSKLSKKNTG